MIVCPFVLILTIVLSVLRFTASDYPFDNFKPFFLKTLTCSTDSMISVVFCKPFRSVYMVMSYVHKRCDEIVTYNISIIWSLLMLFAYIKMSCKHHFEHLYYWKIFDYITSITNNITTCNFRCHQYNTVLLL